MGRVKRLSELDADQYFGSGASRRPLGNWQEIDSFRRLKLQTLSRAGRSELRGLSALEIWIIASIQLTFESIRLIQNISWNGFAHHIQPPAQVV